MLTFHQNTAVCDIKLSLFFTNKGRPRFFSELFFVDGSSMKYYDFGKLARQYKQFILNHRSRSPITWVEFDNSDKEEHMNGIDE